VRRVGQPASDDEDYLRKRCLLHRSNNRSQSKREEQPGHGRSGRQEERCACGRGDGDEVSGDTHPRGDCGRNQFEPMEGNENGKQRRRSEAPATPSNWRSRMERTMQQQAQELTQLHRTVGHLTNLVQAQAAREEAQWLGMRTWMQERAIVGCPPRGRQGVGGGLHKYDSKGHETSSTRPGSERERKRRDREDGRPSARGLATCGYTAGWRTREAPIAAAATEAQTAAQSAAETAARNQAKVSTHTGETVGDSPTMNPDLEGTHRPRRIEHDSKTPDIKEWRELPAPGPGSDFRLEHGR